MEDNVFHLIPTGKWEKYFKGLLTENKERYLREQEFELERMNEIEEIYLAKYCVSSRAY